MARGPRLTVNLTEKMRQLEERQRKQREEIEAEQKKIEAAQIVQFGKVCVRTGVTEHPPEVVAGYLREFEDRVAKNPRRYEELRQRGAEFLAPKPRESASVGEHPGDAGEASPSFEASIAAE